MKNILNYVVEGNSLSKEQAIEVMNQMLLGDFCESQVASLLSMMRLRGETVEEMVGFATAMRAHMLKIRGIDDVVDTCGTGGDGKSTFNISTAAAIVSSASGIIIAKHGNRAISSKSGSADVLEQLAIPIQSTIKEVKESLSKNNMSFLFAPYYHSSMKNVAQVRKSLGFRTVFNLLGPLANPANAKRQVVGVFSTSYAEKLAHVFKELGSSHVLIVTGQDGLDEISISAPTDIVELKNEKISRYTLSPEDVGLTKGEIDDLKVDSTAESASLIKQIFLGKANNSAKQIVAMNAGAAIYVSGKVASLKDGIDRAIYTIESGKAYQQLKNLQKEREYA
ncbi:anthranilate phosphoribosyltransferase [Bacillus carboniphilus]|uniref:Anthranilate phosphoribosyltransferase n=1 Tax=Bacillus carboniphilus TaxID=86663 RepID=A0ABY9JWI0_9BACI|nr:anthranilate phosphoribosyltransferase [Bacillus carboniphilus]WLR43735.1 anthranilate phosphoribosyltransferase [Bacillus carboniphilus]